jgi:hypothetical protein
MGSMHETRGMNMASTTTTTKTEATKAQDATKDAGRVKIGGGTIHFSDSRVSRDATKDAGRVRVGGGTIQF